jgi:hypothetical protein
MYLCLTMNEINQRKHTAKHRPELWNLILINVGVEQSITEKIHHNIHVLFLFRICPPFCMLALTMCKTEEEASAYTVYRNRSNYPNGNLKYFISFLIHLTMLRAKFQIFSFNTAVLFNRGFHVYHSVATIYWTDSTSENGRWRSFYYCCQPESTVTLDW